MFPWSWPRKAHCFRSASPESGVEKANSFAAARSMERFFCRSSTATSSGCSVDVAKESSIWLYRGQDFTSRAQHGSSDRNSDLGSRSPVFVGKQQNPAKVAAFKAGYTEPILTIHFFPPSSDFFPLFSHFWIPSCWLSNFFLQYFMNKCL